MASSARKVDLIDVNARKPMSPVQRAAYDHIRECIEKGERVTQLGIMYAIGSENMTGSTSAGVLKRLEDDGWITRTYYQRGMQVCLTETGQCSVPPSCRTVHWRLREDRVPTLPVRTVRERSAPAAFVIESEARRVGMDFHEFQMQLLVNGLELWLERQEAEE